MIESIIGVNMGNKSKRTKTILSILVGSSVAIPIVCLPLGLRDGSSAALKVRRAYADTFPEREGEEYYAEVQKPETEEWALDKIDDDAAQSILNGGTIKSTYLDGHEPVENASHEFDDVPSYTVFQQYDSSGLPIELVDPQYFAPADEDLYIKADQSILKEYPDMDSKTVTKLVTSDMVKRIGVGDQWSKIRTEDGQEGYVLSNTLSYEMVWLAIDRTVWVDTGSLMLRAEPSTESEILATLYDEQKLHCVEISDKWFHVFTMDGQEGYVYISFTTETPPPTPTPTPTPVPRNSSSGGGGGGGGGSGSSRSYEGGSYVAPAITGQNGDSAAMVAEAMLGKPYVWGASSSSACDCSGLVCFAYRQLGVELPHYSVSLCEVGASVSREDIQRGDIVCWHRGNGYCHHVGIYVGGGMCIDARCASDGICYDSLDMHPILTIRRIFG